MSAQVAISNKLTEALMALEFPVIESDKDTCVWSDTGRVESPKVSPHCPDRLLFGRSRKDRGTRANQFVWYTSINFQELVCIDEVLDQFAKTPVQIKYASVDDPCKVWSAVLQEAELAYRPSQQSEVGTTARLKFAVTTQP